MAKTDILCSLRMVHNISASNSSEFVDLAPLLRFSALCKNYGLLPRQQLFPIKLFDFFPCFSSLSHYASAGCKEQTTKFSSANFQKILSPSYIILRKLEKLVGKQCRCGIRWLIMSHLIKICLQIQLFSSLILKELNITYNKIIRDWVGKNCVRRNQGYFKKNKRK